MTRNERKTWAGFGIFGLVFLIAWALSSAGCSGKKPDENGDTETAKPAGSPESFEMIQRERLLPDTGWTLDVARYAQDGSLLTTNAALELRWIRERLAELGAPGRPAVCAHISVRFIFDGSGKDYPAGSFWKRYDDAMRPHAYLDGDGLPVRDPWYPVGFVLDPRTNPYQTMYRFFAAEWGEDFEADPGAFGLYLDDYADLYPRYCEGIGVTGPQFEEWREAFRRGRTWLANRLRKRFGEAIVIVPNWGSDQQIDKFDAAEAVNGVTFEGAWTDSMKALMVRQFLVATNRGRSCYSTAWNADPIKELGFPTVRYGSHWVDRWNAGDEPGSPN